MQDRRHLQGLRHDPPQHGDHARLHHDRLRHFSRHAPKGAFNGYRQHLQHGLRRRRHVYERHGDGPGQRPCGQCGDHRRGRGFHRVHAGAQYRDRLSLPLHRGRRRGRDKAARMQGLRRGNAGHCQNRRQERHLLVPDQGRHVRSRRKLGPRPVRHRLFRRAGRREQNRRAVCVQGWNHSGL